MAGKSSTAGRKLSAPLAQDVATDNNWSAARPRTLVDHAVDAILSAASRGLILPGDRIAEPELVAKLGMSRVPIREALRILESQGIVTSEPYKGIRLMEISHQRLEQIIDVRVPLETLACRRAIEAGRNGAEQLNLLYQGVAQMQTMMQNNDVYGFASADTDFHRTLCSFAHNPVLSNLWESIARQLTVIFGLSTMGKSMSDIIEEHQRLINVFADGDIAKISDEVENHIRIQALDVDYETLITQRRQHRSALG